MYGFDCHIHLGMNCVATEIEVMRFMCVASQKLRTFFIYKSLKQKEPKANFSRL